MCDECAFNQSLNLAHQVTSWTLRRRVGSRALMKDEDGSYSSRVDDDDDEDDEDDEDEDGSHSSRVLILLQSFPLKVIPRREWCVCRNKIFKISIPFFLDLAYFQQRGGSAPLIPRGVPFARLALKRRRTTWNLNFRSLRLFRRNFATASSEYENWSLLPTLRMQRKI